MDEELKWLRGEALSEDEMRRESAHALGIPFVVLESADIALATLSLIPEPLSRTHNVVAYREALDGSVEIALLDLADLPAIDFLRPRKIKACLTTRESMKRALLLYQKHLKEKFAGLLEQGAEATDSLLRHALLSGASYVHLEPSTGGTLIRYRIEGILTEAMRLSRSAGTSIVEKLKSLAKLFPVDTAAQEGRFKFEHEEEMVAVSVSTVPTVHGEKVLLRLARERQGQSGFTLSSLGFHGRALERLYEVLSRRRGLFLVSGEGTTTLLYTLLDLINTPRLSLMTVETHVAHRLPLVWQTQTRPEIGLGVAGALRAAIRSDPDVVMIDSVDSPEAARLAEEAARRGIFVLTGARAQELLASSTFVSQRLLKRLCPECRGSSRFSRSELEEFEKAGARFSHVLVALKQEGVLDNDLLWRDVPFYRAVGCPRCEGGFKGMIGVQAVTPQEEEALTLLEDGLFKAAQGLVDVRDVLALAER